MTTLPTGYTLALRARELVERLAAGDEDPAAVDALLAEEDALHTDILAKLAAYRAIRMQAEAKIAHEKVEAALWQQFVDRHKANIRHYEATIDRVMEMALRVADADVELSGCEPKWRLEDGTAARIQHYKPQTLEKVEPGKIPARYVVDAYNDNAIKADLLAGKEVPGCRLVGGSRKLLFKAAKANGGGDVEQG